MSNKSLAIFVGASALILFGVWKYASTPSTAPSMEGGADATIGSNPLGAATGTTNSNGDPFGGLGSTGG